MMRPAIPPSLLALAAGDMRPLAHAFALSGFKARQVADGILTVHASGPAGGRPQVLVSAGIHGDETGPIAMLDALLSTVSSGLVRLQADLMVVVGNPAAIAQNKRYLNVDLNRLFRVDGPPRHEGWELHRASEIMRATHAFFDGSSANTWHLDLHTAIRDSLYPAFAIVPGAVSGPKRAQLLAMLQQGGAGAVVFNDKPSSSFSAYTASRHGVAGATVELGKVGPLAGYDGRFGDMCRALRRLLAGDMASVGGMAPAGLAQFKVEQEMIKSSTAFRLAFGPALPNFTRFPARSLLAEDAGKAIRCGDAPEYILFPNPDVDVGMRAGLSLVRTV